MSALSSDAYPRDDEDVAGFVAGLGLPGLVDVHTHFMPDRLQRAVWAFFDRLDDPPWPVTYRDGEQRRLEVLDSLGVIAHTALAYPHRPGMLAWLNEHTLALAERVEAVVPTFTLYPEHGVEEAVADAVARGGRLAKVHLQVGRFHTTDPRLATTWELLAASGVVVLVHASAVYGVDGGEEYCGADAIRALLDAHPDLTVVVAHLGAPDVDDFLDLVDEAPQVWLDTAMAPTEPAYLGPLAPATCERIATVWPRLLFGSDFPAIPHRYAAAVRGLSALRLDAARLRAVLHDNAASLLPVPDARPGRTSG